MAQVSYSMATSGSHRSNQSEVWADIAEKSAHLRASSPTGAMEAMFLGHAPFIDECVASLGAVDGQVGAVFAIGPRVLGLDLFDSPATLQRLLPKLLRSVAVDAIDANSEATPPSAASVESFLATVSAAAIHESAAIGLGRDLRLTGPGITGAALATDGRVVHLSAFALD